MRGRSTARHPAIFRSAGRTKSSKVTIADTGLPGSPKTGRSSSEPNVIGLPGRIATFHKWSSAPHLTSASRTRSSSPTDTPADDTSTTRSEEHTSELQSPCNLVCRLLLEKKKKKKLAL